MSVLDDQDEILAYLARGAGRGGAMSYDDGGSVDQEDLDENDQYPEDRQAQKDINDDETAFLTEPTSADKGFEEDQKSQRGLTDEEMGLIPPNARPTQQTGQRGLTDAEMGLTADGQQHGFTDEQMGLANHDIGVSDDLFPPQKQTGLGVMEKHIAHGLPSGVASLPAIGAMGAAGASIGTAVLPGVGTAVGGAAGALIGALSGGYITSKVADWLYQQAGMTDPGGYFDQREMEAGEKEHPGYAAAGDLIANMIGFKFDKAATIGARLAGALLQGGLTVGQEKAAGQPIDPWQVGAATLGGAALTKPRGFAANLMGKGAQLVSGKQVAGRPNFPRTGLHDAEEDNVDQNDLTTTARGVAAENPPVNTDVDVGGNLAPARSSRTYPKVFGQRNPDSDNQGALIGQMQNGPPQDIAAALQRRQEAQALRAPGETTAPLQPGQKEFGQRQPVQDVQNPTTPEFNKGAPEIQAVGRMSPEALVELSRVQRARLAQAAARFRGQLPATAFDSLGADNQRELNRPISEAEYGDAAIAQSLNRGKNSEELTSNSLPAEEPVARPPGQDDIPPHPDEHAAGAEDEAAIPPNARPTEHITVKGDEPPPGAVYQHPELPDLTVDSTKMVPKYAELAPDGKRLYVDSRIPSLLDVDGKKLNPALPLGVRAAVYHQVYNGPGNTKALAKEAGLAAESEWLQSRGYDPQKYRTALKNSISDEAPTVRGQTAIDQVKPILDAMPKVKEWFNKQPDKGLAARQLLEAQANRRGKTKAGGYAEPRVPGKVPTVEGVGTTARTQGEAKARAAVVKAAKEAFDKFKPKEGSPVPTTKEQKNALKARLNMAVEHVERVGNYRPRDLSGQPELKWVLAAKRLVNSRMTQKQINKFVADEQLLRTRTAGDTKLVTTEDAVTGNLANRNKRPTVEIAEANAAKEGRDIDWANLSDQEVEDMAKAQQVADKNLNAKVAKARPQWEIDAEARRQKMAEQKAARQGTKPTPSSIRKFMNDEKGGAALPAQAKSFLSKAKEFLTRPPSEDWRASSARTPEEKYARSIDDRLYAVDKRLVGHYRTLMQRAQSWDPKYANAKTMAKIYRAKETGNLSFLTAGERKFMSTELEPLWDANKQMMKAIAAIDPTFEFDPDSNHIHRIADMPDFNPALAKEYKPSANPIESSDSPDRSLNTITSAMKERSFMALHDKNGNIKIVSPDSRTGGFHIWKQGKSQLVKAPETPNGDPFEFKKGNEYMDKQGNVWTLQEALTPDIERNGRFRNGQMAKYVQNAGLSAIKANGDLATVLEHMKFLDNITKNDPVFKKLATRNIDKATDLGWSRQPSKLFPFDKYYMHPELKAVFDHYAQPGFEGNAMDKWRDLSRGITKLMFWTPTAHAMNVGAHWFVARGWNWMNPIGYARLAATTARAIHSVITQDHFQNVLRDNGAGTVYGGVLNDNWLRNVARAAGEDMTEHNPTKWDPVVKELGLDSARDLARGIYKGSSKIMWAVNDVFLTQHIMEKMEAGKSLQDAIMAAERHIPNYRVPVKVMGSDFASKFISDPGFTAFGRYRYGVFNSYAHIIKGLVNGTGEQRVEAAGHLMALGILAFMIKPVLDKAAQVITGNDDAEIRARGPLTLPYHFIQALRGEEDPVSALKEAVVWAPLVSTVMGMMGNRDFADRKIIEPGDVRQVFDPDNDMGGRLSAARRVATQGGEYAARNLISPYGTFANAYGADRGVLETLRNQALDIKEPSERALRWRNKQPHRDEVQAMHRSEPGRGRGPAEDLFNEWFDNE